MVRGPRTNWKWSANLQVALGGEGSAADGADERFLSGVRALVDLQGAGRREVLPAGAAVVLPGRTSKRGGAEEGGGPRAEGDLRLAVTVHLGFDGDVEVLTCNWNHRAT